MNEKEKYLEFLNEISKGVEEFYKGEVTTECCTSVKNNGISMTGIMLKRKGEQIAPNFYMEKQFQEWECGKQTIQEIVEYLCCVFEIELQANRDLAKSICFKWENMQKGIFMRLVNRERNQELLKKVPYVEFMDLAIIYFYSVDISEGVQGTLVLTKEHQKLLGVTREELHQAAEKNIKEQCSIKLYQMKDLILRLKEKIGVFVPEPVMEQGLMYVLSNESGMFGSIAMFFEEELKKISEQLGKSFYVLPSSVHEVIIVPEYQVFSLEKFSEIVQEINATQVQETEILSDSVYYYDKNLEQLRRVG